MKISKLLKELREIKKSHGDIEVTCTGSTLPDEDCNKTCGFPAVYETTVETLIVTETHPRFGKAVRLWL